MKSAASSQSVSQQNPPTVPVDGTDRRMNVVTVVIPVFNSLGTLANCLNGPGLSYQGSRPRIIAVDNGSQDGSGDLAASLGAQVTYASRPGSAAARNAGLAMVDTEYVAILDSNCVPQEGWLDRMVSGLETSDHIAAGGAIRWMSNNPDIQMFYQQEYARNENCCSPEPSSYVVTCNAIFRRGPLFELGGFDPRLNLCEDLELGLRLSQQGATFLYVPDAVVTVSPAETYRDQFMQLYKYGVGLE